MKVSVLLEKLKRGLSVLERTVTSRSTLPILNNILIKVEDDRVVLSATDLEVGINYYLGGKVDTTGSITVPGKVLSGFIGSLNEEKISLKLDGNILNTKTEKSEANFNGVPADEFPVIPRVKGNEIFKIKGDALKTALNHVAFSASYDETRPILTGVYFIVQKGVLKLVATDSYRLAEKTIETETNGETKFIMPIKAVQELQRILTTGEVVKVVASSNQVMFVLPDLEFITRTIEGDYPDYEQIIPKSFKTKVLVNHIELASTIKTASLFSKENANNVKLLFNKTGLVVEATSSQLGNFKSELSAEVSGEEGEISFNTKYLVDVFNVVEGNRLVLEMTGKLNPTSIKPEGKTDVLYIVMPLRN